MRRLGSQRAPTFFTPTDNSAKAIVEDTGFYVPSIIAGTATACFTIATVLSA
jgi:hypothetical protein